MATAVAVPSNSPVPRLSSNVPPMVLCARCKREIKSESRSAFAQAMKDARAKSGLLQVDAAARIDATPSVISRLESGDTLSHLTMVRVLLVAYGCDDQTVESIVALHKKEKARQREKK